MVLASTGIAALLAGAACSIAQGRCFVHSARQRAAQGLVGGSNGNVGHAGRDVPVNIFQTLEQREYGSRATSSIHRILRAGRVDSGS